MAAAIRQRRRRRPASASASSCRPQTADASVGHGGAIYGFATELAACPNEKLGVVVVASRDCANAVTDASPTTALRLHARREAAGKPLPTIDDDASPYRAALAAKLAGPLPEGTDGQIDLEFTAHGERLWLVSGRGGCRVELRQSGQTASSRTTGLRSASPSSSTTSRFQARHATSSFKKDRRSSRPARRPRSGPGSIGEYGWDHNMLYILEKDGKLHALIEWIVPLSAEGGDARTSSLSRPMRPVPRREAGLHARRRRPGDASRGGERRLRAAQDRRRGRRDVQDQAGAAGGRAARKAARRPSRRRRRANSASRTWSI